MENLEKYNKRMKHGYVKEVEPETRSLIPETRKSARKEPEEDEKNPEQRREDENSSIGTNLKIILGSDKKDSSDDSSNEDQDKSGTGKKLNKVTKKMV